MATGTNRDVTEEAKEFNQFPGTNRIFTVGSPAFGNGIFSKGNQVFYSRKDPVLVTVYPPPR